MQVLCPTHNVPVNVLVETQLGSVPVGKKKITKYHPASFIFALFLFVTHAAPRMRTVVNALLALGRRCQRHISCDAGSPQ